MQSELCNANVGVSFRGVFIPKACYMLNNIFSLIDSTFDKI